MGELSQVSRSQFLARSWIDNIVNTPSHHHNHHAYNDQTMHHLCHIISSSSAYKDHTRVRIIGRPDPVSVVCCTAAPRFLRRRVFPQINLPPTHKRSPVSTFHHSTPLSPEHQSKTLVKHRRSAHRHHQQQQQPHHITITTILIIIIAMLTVKIAIVVLRPRLS